MIIPANAYTSITLLPTQAASEQADRISTENARNGNGRNYNVTASTSQLWTAKKPR